MASSEKGKHGADHFQDEGPEVSDSAVASSSGAASSGARTSTQARRTSDAPGHGPVAERQMTDPSTASSLLAPLAQFPDPSAASSVPALPAQAARGDGASSSAASPSASVPCGSTDTPVPDVGADAHQSNASTSPTQTSSNRAEPSVPLQARNGTPELSTPQPSQGSRTLSPSECIEALAPQERASASRANDVVAPLPRPSRQRGSGDVAAAPQPMEGGAAVAPRDPRRAPCREGAAAAAAGALGRAASGPVQPVRPREPPPSAMRPRPGEGARGRAASRAQQ